jgi:hypothetical protein
MRGELSGLRARINAHNAQTPLGARRERVVVYVGQCVLPEADPALDG